MYGCIHTYICMQNTHMMWDFPLYAMNMFYCHWLIKKLLSVNGLTEYSQAGKDIERG